MRATSSTDIGTSCKLAPAKGAISSTDNRHELQARASEREKIIDH